ncbi:hypothetical protein GCM10011351_24040 [Paraliobacillus quinghaiensis]|uniref:Uncharacterized protein n=1 Tax=Paraliobacillus quinghaiensis TaxID=470815 RepID=A0A917TTT0_9BACI|nr:hypothetical protein [Paraliobacillus quinghaiensis]GGM37039.1 hypothetical protein GCM10011351_24040 [Paraliobacillus quinghaiensis]
MTLLPRQKSSLLAQLEVIIPRLATNDLIYPTLTARLKREKSGYIGEKSLDYYLNFFTKKIPLLHDVRMEGQDNFFSTVTAFTSKK